MSDFDPDKYLAGVGQPNFDPDEYLKSKKPGGYASDTFKSLGTGLMEGLANAASTGGVAAQAEMGQPVDVPNAAQMRDIFEKNITGPWHKPETKPGQYGERVGEFLGNPASYIGGPASLAGKAGVTALSGIGSKAGEDLGAKYGFPGVGSFLGAVAGGATPSLAAKVITPNAANPLHLQDVNTLEGKYGIKLTAGDRTGNKTIRAAESELSPYTNEQQKRQFEQAAFDQIGESIGERRVTGPGGAIETMKDRIGRRFDTLQARNRADIDPDLVNETLGIQKKYTGVPGLYGDETENAVKGALGRLSQVYSQGGGSLTGTQYRELRTEFNNAAMGAEGPKARALHEIVDSLDNNMERTIGRTNPIYLGAFKAAREDYKKALTLQRWGKSKDLTPDALDRADAHIYGEAANVTGKSPFSELAQSGKRTISAYQTSETARRQFIEHLPKAVAGTAGFLIGQHSGAGVEGGVGGLLLGSEGLGGPFIRAGMGKALMSPPVQGYLGNQLISREAQESLGQPLSMRLARALAQTQGQ